MPPPQGLDEDDETLSLLANQDSPGLSGYRQISSLFAMEEEQQVPESEMRRTVTLPEGHAEKTFFTMCGGNGFSGGGSSDDEVINAVNDILTDINNEILIRKNEDEEGEETSEDSRKDNTTLVKGSGGKSGSLVVDVHIDPDNDTSSTGSSSEMDNPPTGSSLSSNSSSNSNVKPPSKHSVSRFQRCYSDSSHSSPKTLKGKYTKWIKAQENADKIETIYDGSQNQNGGASKSFDHHNNRFRHFSESAHAAGERFNLQDELLQFKKNFTARQHLRNFESGEQQKRRSDPVTMDSIKFDLFDDESSNPEENLERLDRPRSVIEDSGAAGVSSLSASTSSLRASVLNHPLYPESSSPPASISPNPLILPSDSSAEEDLRGRFHPFPSILVETGSCLSNSSSTASLPACRICQLPSMEPNNQLISPCRCLGSIRYVHNNCLLKWLEVSSKRRNGTASCELCQYQYLRHKKFVISHWRFPECSFRDKILHLFFIISVCLMITCAAVTILCFKEDRGPYRKANSNPGELTSTEMITLSCGVMFFFAFFIAMYVEVKAKNTVYQLICKFFYMNHEWSVEEYDRRRDLSCSKASPKNESASCLA